MDAILSYFRNESEPIKDFGATVSPITNMEVKL